MNQARMHKVPLEEEARDEAWSRPRNAADRYLRAVGVSLSFVRRELVEAAAERLESSERSCATHVLEVRILACVERVLCERLGAKPGSETSDPDTAQRRLMFSIDPTVEAQLALAGPTAQAAGEGQGSLQSVMRIPAIRSTKPMSRQVIDYRRSPLHRFLAASRPGRTSVA